MRIMKIIVFCHSCLISHPHSVVSSQQFLSAGQCSGNALNLNSRVVKFPAWLKIFLKEVVHGLPQSVYINPTTVLLNSQQLSATTSHDSTLEQPTTIRYCIPRQYSWTANNYPLLNPTTVHLNSQQLFATESHDSNLEQPITIRYWILSYSLFHSKQTNFIYTHHHPKLLSSTDWRHMYLISKVYASGADKLTFLLT
jgi:hypothetical protein